MPHKQSTYADLVNWRERKLQAAYVSPKAKMSSTMKISMSCSNATAITGCMPLLFTKNTFGYNVRTASLDATCAILKKYITSKNTNIGKISVDCTPLMWSNKIVIAKSYYRDDDMGRLETGIAIANICNEVKRPNIIRRIVGFTRRCICRLSGNFSKTMFPLDQSNLGQFYAWVEIANICPTRFRIVSLFDASDITCVIFETNDLAVVYKLAI
jgi:hypothetical protein